MFAVLMVLTGCTGRAIQGEELTCTASVSETIETVVSVAWTPPAAGTSSVVFDDGVTDPLTTPETSDSAVDLPLLGMPEDTDVSWTGTTVFEDGTSASCSGVTHTGSAPSNIPRPETYINEDGQDPAQYVMGAFYTGAGGTGAITQLAAYRRDGTLVWYLNDAENSSGVDWHYANEGGIWFNEYIGPMGSEYVSLRRVSLTGEILDDVPTPYAHHLFCQLADDTLVYQTVDIRDFTDPETGETGPWVGDGIVELHPDGSSEQIFSTWDAIEPHHNVRSRQTSVYQGVDWTHGNALIYKAETDEYLLSTAFANDILTINRTTREMTAIYGIDGLPATPQFDFPHDATWLDNGNLLTFSEDDTGGGAVEYEVTDAGMTEVWRSPFESKPIALPQARRYPNGNTFVKGGLAGYLSEVQDDGTTVWAMNPTGSVFAQFAPVSNLYTGEL